MQQSLKSRPWYQECVNHRRYSRAPASKIRLTVSAWVQCLQCLTLTYCTEVCSLHTRLYLYKLVQPRNSKRPVTYMQDIPATGDKQWVCLHQNDWTTTHTICKVAYHECRGCCQTLHHVMPCRRPHKSGQKLHCIMFLSAVPALIVQASLTTRKHLVPVCVGPDGCTCIVLLTTAADGDSLVKAALTEIKILANHACITYPSKVCPFTQVTDHPESAHYLIGQHKYSLEPP